MIHTSHVRQFLEIPKSRSLEEFIRTHTDKGGAAKKWRERDPFSTYRCGGQ